MKHKNYISFVDEIKKEKNTKKLEIIVRTILNDKKECNNEIGSGSYGVVNVITQTNVYKLNDGNDIFYSPVKKTLFNDSRKQGFKFEHKNDTLILNLNNNYNEIIISIIMADLFFKRITPHIVALLDYNICSDNNSTELIMENLSNNTKHTNFGVFNNLMEEKKIKVNPELLNSIVIQFLHTVHILQKEYKFLHLDLEDRNLFIKIVEPDEKYYGLNFMEYDYLVYKIGNEKVYLKNSGVLIKIGDFSLSMLKVGKMVCSTFSNIEVFKEEKLIKNYAESKFEEFIPEHIYFIRSMVMQYGLYDKMIVDLLTEFDDIEIVFGQNSISYNKLFELREKNKKEYKIESIFSSSIFDSYKKVPSDLKNPLFIG